MRGFTNEWITNFEREGWNVNVHNDGFDVSRRNVSLGITGLHLHDRELIVEDVECEHFADLPADEADGLLETTLALLKELASAKGASVVQLPTKHLYPYCHEQMTKNGFNYENAVTLKSFDPYYVWDAYGWYRSFSACGRAFLRTLKAYKEDEDPTFDFFLLFKTYSITATCKVGGEESNMTLSYGSAGPSIMLDGHSNSVAGLREVKAFTTNALGHLRRRGYVRRMITPTRSHYDMVMERYPHLAHHKDYIHTVLMGVVKDPHDVEVWASRSPRCVVQGKVPKGNDQHDLLEVYKIMDLFVVLRASNLNELIYIGVDQNKCFLN